MYGWPATRRGSRSSNSMTPATLKTLAGLWTEAGFVALELRLKCLTARGATAGREVAAVAEDLARGATKGNVRIRAAVPGLAADPTERNAANPYLAGSAASPEAYRGPGPGNATEQRNEENNNKKIRWTGADLPPTENVIVIQSAHGRKKN